MDGWIKLNRKMLNWEWYTDLQTKSLFVHLLLTVSSSATTWRGRAVKAGSRVANMPTLIGETGMDERAVKRALSNLELTNDIVIERENPNERHWIVRVVNWPKYQCLKKQTEEPEGTFVGANLYPQSDSQTAPQPAPQEFEGPFVGANLYPQSDPQNRKEAKDIKQEERKNTLSCVPERAQARAERDTHNNEFSSFPSSIDPYPRTAEEVKQAAAMQGIAMTDDEARAFIDYNASVGWMARGEPIRKWKALLNGWHQKELLRERRNQSGNGTKWDSRYVSKDYSHVVSDEIA